MEINKRKLKAIAFFLALLALTLAAGRCISGLMDIVINYFLFAICFYMYLENQNGN